MVPGELRVDKRLRTKGRVEASTRNVHACYPPIGVQTEIGNAKSRPIERHVHSRALTPIGGHSPRERGRWILKSVLENPTLSYTLCVVIFVNSVSEMIVFQTALCQTEIRKS